MTASFHSKQNAPNHYDKPARSFSRLQSTTGGASTSTGAASGAESSDNEEGEEREGGMGEGGRCVCVQRSRREVCVCVSVCGGSGGTRGREVAGARARLRIRTISKCFSTPRPNSYIGVPRDCLLDSHTTDVLSLLSPTLDSTPPSLHGELPPCNLVGFAPVDHALQSPSRQYPAHHGACLQHQFRASAFQSGASGPASGWRTYCR